MLVAPSQLKSDEDGEYSTGVRMSLSRGLLPVDSDLSAVADAEGQARLEVGRAMVAADSWTVRVVNSGERNATFALELKTRFCAIASSVKPFASSQMPEQVFETPPAKGRAYSCCYEEASIRSLSRVILVFTLYIRGTLKKKIGKWT
eukprot:5329956-Pleurochrysis_carterae.AAC.1